MEPARKSGADGNVRGAAAEGGRELERQEGRGVGREEEGGRVCWEH